MFRNFFRRKPAQSEKNEDRIVADVYGSMNQEYVKKLFYGGEDSAGKILKPLVRILYGEDCSITEEYTKDASFFLYTGLDSKSRRCVSGIQYAAIYKRGIKTAISRIWSESD